MNSSLRHKLLRKYARIVECSRLLDIARSDMAFAAPASPSPGEIIYVADTNVIQAFIEPSKWGRSTRLFHDFSLWNPSDRESGAGARELEEIAGIQSAMLAAESVFYLATSTGDRQMLMSQKHQEECELQIGHIEKNFMERIGSFPKRKARHAQEIDSVARLEQDDTLLMGAGSLWVGELRGAGLKPADYQDAWQRYLTVKLGQTLAKEDLVEPYQQIRRLVTQETLGISRLEWRFEAPEHNELRQEASDWYNRLCEELASRAHAPSRFATESEAASRGRQFERSENSLRSDAETIAYLSIISRRSLRHNQRVVFVTADSLVLNAYRRWYGQNGELVPYLMRPLAIYGAQYNLYVSGSRRHKSTGWFSNMRAALEAQLFPLAERLNDRYPALNPAARYAGVRARDLFCADVESGCFDDDQEFADELFGVGSLASSLDARLDALAIQLRWLERVAMASVPNVVSKRLDAATSDAEQFLQLLSTKGVEANGRYVDSWLLGHIRRETVAGFSFSLPFVVRWLQSAAVGKVLELTPRVGVMLRLDLSFKTSRAEAKRLPAPEWVEKLRLLSATDAQIALTELTKEPAEIFALASWVAFRQSLWSDALKFADLASRTVTNRSSELRSECWFLKAISMRIRMMSDAPVSGGSVDFWRSDMEGAVAVLTEFMAGLGSDHRIRAIRARSERASVRLTYCAWVALGRLGELAPYSAERLDLREVYSSAVADLFQCVDRVRDLQTIVDAGELHLSAVQRMDLDWTRTQAALGPECARIVYDCLKSKLDPVRMEAYLPQMAVRRDLDEMFENPSNEYSGSLIVKIYSLSQKIRSADHLESARQYGSELLEINEVPNLELDAHMLRLLQASAEELLEISSDPVRRPADVWSEIVAGVAARTPS